jgi:uncharacterized iron-regulated protein
LPARVSAAAPQNQKDLGAMLRKLEKEIETARGLKFKKPVVVSFRPRPHNAAPKFQGYYSTKDKAVVLYDDVAGNYQRGVLVHEMVHALQDQHFGLDRLHQEKFASDAELARSALVEGDATYTMIEVLRKEQPRVAAMLDVPLQKAHNLQNAFLYAQGARYVKALKDRGGWPAVNAAYKFPPRSTAAVLHPGSISAINLGPGKTHGELAIIRLLTSNPQTAPSAVQAAAGWIGDREVAEHGSKSWVVAFADRPDALRFQAAMARFQAAQDSRSKEVVTRPGENVRRGPGGKIMAVLARGDQVLVLDAPNEKAYRSLLDRLEGPLPLVIYEKKTQAFITLGQLVDRLAEADLVCVGETHDSEPQHRVQLQIIMALYARDTRLGVAMEMFQRPFQPALDRYLRGEATEEDFLKATEYRRRWGYAWSLYRPIVDFCRKNAIPVAALNTPGELVRRLSRVGYAKLTEAEKKQLGRVDFQVKEHRDYWFDLLARLHGNKNASPEEKERGYQVMTVWDEYMGASAARFHKERGLRRLVVLAGAGHIDRGFGIPARAAKRTGGKALTVHLEVGVDPKKAAAEAVTDFVVVVK